MGVVPVAATENVAGWPAFTAALRGWLVIEGGLPYRKLIDLRGVVPRMSDDDIMVLGARVSAYAHLEPRGPIAVVSTAHETDLFVRRFMNLGGAKRPMRLFTSMDDARQWLQETPEA